MVPPPEPTIAFCALEWLLASVDKGVGFQLIAVGEAGFTQSAGIRAFTRVDT